jgi:hypothetical protein
MLMTYEAILEGDKLRWKGSKPQQVSEKSQIAVYVTLLEKISEEPHKQTQGRQMAEALANLAALKQRSIADPLLWQKEIRQDKPLPRE